MLPSVDEILALDALTLREHTELAGVAFDLGKHKTALEASFALNELCAVRREGKLVAYAMLRPDTDASWFVGAFNTHPSFRTHAVISELFGKLASLARERGIQQLKSHVYKTNRLSIAFHRKLGFQSMRENDKAIEFVATLGAMEKRPAIRRAMAGVLRNT